MVFSRIQGRLKFLGVFRHTVKKPQNTCTTQLASSIVFVYLFPNGCIGLAYGGPEVQLFSTNHNYFLQTTTFFYKSQLFSTNHNFFLQIVTIFYILATFFYKSQLFSTILQLFSIIHNFFLQITTFFCKIATFFHRRNKRVFGLDKREKRYFISLPHVLRGWQVDWFG